MYPNPSPDGKFTIQLPIQDKAIVNYSLVNSAGILLKSGRLNTKGDTLVSLDLSNTAVATVSGMYYLVLKTSYGEQLKTIPLLKR